MCCTSRPRSSTRVLRPWSHSSFAAQPPEIPEPMTMASYVRSGLVMPIRYQPDAARSHLLEQRREPGIRAQRIQIGVVLEPLFVAEAVLHRFFDARHGLVDHSQRAVGAR